MVKAIVLLVDVFHVAVEKYKKREAGNDIYHGYSSVGIVKDIPSKSDDKTLLGAIGGIEGPRTLKVGLKCRSLKSLYYPSNTVVSLYEQ